MQRFELDRARQKDRDPEETTMSIFRARHQYEGVICRHYSFAATVEIR